MTFKQTDVGNLTTVPAFLAAWHLAFDLLETLDTGNDSFFKRSTLLALRQT